MFIYGHIVTALETFTALPINIVVNTQCYEIPRLVWAVAATSQASIRHSLPSSQRTDISTSLPFRIGEPDGEMRHLVPIQ